MRVNVEVTVPSFVLLPGTRQIFTVAGDVIRFAKYALRTESIDGLPVRNPTVPVT